MFWIFLTAMAFVWFIIPKNDNVWTVLDEKPKRYKWYSESSTSMTRKKYKVKKKYKAKKKYDQKGISSTLPHGRRSIQREGTFLP